MASTGFSFHVNGVDLHYEVAGEGEPLLWLHGFMGSGADWKYIFAEPPAGYRVIAPDLRAAIPRSYLWVVPNGGHGPVFGDAAPRFAETALTFLRGDWTRS